MINKFGFVLHRANQNLSAFWSFPARFEVWRSQLWPMSHSAVG